MFFRANVPIIAKNGEGDNHLQQKLESGARRAAFPVLYNAANSVYQGYMSLFWTHLGLSRAALGTLGCVSAVAALAAQPLWGRLGDRVPRRSRLLTALCLGAAAAMLAALLRPGWIAQMVCASVFYAFFCALLPLGDAILLASGGNFGAYRLAGGLSFALVGMGFGALRLPTEAVVIFVAGFLALAALSAFLLPDTPGRKNTDQPALRTLLQNRDLLRLLAFLLPVQATLGCYYTFFAPHFEALGGSRALLGVGYLLASLSEAPYLLLSGRIYRRFGAAKPMCIAALILSLRWFFIGLAPSPALLVAAQALHGGGLTVLSVSMARWIADNVPKEHAASGQILLNMVAFGASRALGNLGGGLLAEHMGASAAFLACSGVCLLSAAVFARFALRR